MNKGSANFLKTSVQQEITIVIASKATESTMTAAVLANISLKAVLLYAKYPTATVRRSCRVSRRYTFLIKLFLAR
jgi:hypothetical protein